MSIVIHPFEITNADTIEEIKNGFTARISEPRIVLKEVPKEYYRSGWQSWSLTAWHSPDFIIPVQEPRILHPMQTDPVYAEEQLPVGSWLGAVRFSSEKILLLGALGLDSNVKLVNNCLEGKYECPQKGDWFIGFGDEIEVFESYANMLGQIYGKVDPKPMYNVWCSWYSFYVAIDEAKLFKVFDEFGETPFDVLQVDDGWQMSVGDWDVNTKFPSGMPALADKIKSSGRKAGLWLAPLIAVQSSQLFQTRPDWFLKDIKGKFVSAGFNWGERLFALDTTHPDVLTFLSSLMKKVREWGFEYVKLDFLYAGALPGNRMIDTPREVAYRKGLSVLRESLGDAYFLTCGAPVIPSLGLCDAMRIGPDVAAEWENYRDAFLFYNSTTPGAKNAIRTTINRFWLKPLVAVDPDVVFFSTTHNSMKEEERKLLQDLALICEFKATSDVPNWLGESEKSNLTRFLNHKPTIARQSRYVFTIDGEKIDFGPAINLPPIPTGLAALGRKVLSFLANKEIVLQLFDRLFKMDLDRKTQQI